MGPTRFVAAFALVATMAVSACGGSESKSEAPTDGSEDVTAVEEVATGVSPADTRVLAPVVSAKEVMFAIGGTETSPSGSGIVRSPAPGEPWEWVELPDGPESSTTELTRWDVRSGDDGGVVVWASKSTLSEVSLWAWSSLDGTEWQGGSVGSFPGGGSGGRFQSVGDALINVVQRGATVVVLSSSDGAQSWQEAPIAGITVVEGESAGLALGPWTLSTGEVRTLVGYYGETSRGFENVLAEAPSPVGPWTIADPACPPSEQAPRGHCYPSIEAGAVTARGIEVSLDGGQTWADATFEQPLAQDPHRVVSGFSSLAPLPTGGWIATVDGYIPAGGGSLAWVVHSTDGRTWSVPLGPGQNGCAQSPMDTDQPWAQAHPPVLTGNAAVVAFTCPGAGSGLHRVDATATLLHQVGRSQRLGEPFEHGSTVVAPIQGVDDQTVQGFAVVRP